MKPCALCLLTLLPVAVVLSAANDRDSKQISYLAEVQDAYSSKFVKQARGLGLTVWPLSLIGWFEIRVSKAKPKSPNHAFWKRRLQQLPGIIYLEEQHEKKISLRQGHTTPNDPHWQNGSMWYWERTNNMHVQNVWDRGFKGKGRQIAIIDDGVDYRNKEFQGRRFNKALSYDYTRRTSDARPAYGQTHGTKVAGVAAAAVGNSFCGAGAAPEAFIVGVRLIGYSGGTTPANEAESLLGMNRHSSTDVFVASWGAIDDGQTVDGPAPITKKAIKKAATEGRGGLGSLLVFAAGNGGNYTDDCICDGYISNQYTVAVQVVNRDGTAPYYTEPCAAAAFSVYVDNGLVAPLPIAFTPSCSSRFAGTSAAAPAAGGILALALDHNPHLRRRDLLELIVKASNPKVLDQTGWIPTAAGYKFHPRFGFGLLDAQALDDLVDQWSTRKMVYAERETDVTGKCGNTTCNFDVNIICAGPGTVEQLSFTLTLNATKTRGDIELFIKSPGNTKIPILNKRPNDVTPDGFKDWEFSTMAFWGESPNGRWELEVTNAIIITSLPILSITYRESENGTECDESSDSGGLSIGAIIGISIAAVAIPLGTGGLITFIIIFRKRQTVENEKKHPTKPEEEIEVVTQKETIVEGQKTDPIFVSHR